MRYDELIEKMRISEPQIPHPEEVTGRILERIELRSQDGGAAVRMRVRSSMTQWMRIVPACTGIAATVVMVLSLLIAHAQIYVTWTSFPAPYIGKRIRIWNIIVKSRPCDSLTEGWKTRP